MLIKSLYAVGAKSAVVSFRFENISEDPYAKKWVLFPIDLWQSSPKQRSFIDAFITGEPIPEPGEDLRIVVQADEGSEPWPKAKSMIKDLIAGNCNARNITIINSFKSAVGIASYRAAQIKERTDASRFPQAERLTVEINQLDKEPSAAALAFLQAFLFMDKHVSWDGEAQTVALMSLGGPSSYAPAPFGVESLRPKPNSFQQSRRNNQRSLRTFI